MSLLKRFLPFALAIVQIAEIAGIHIFVESEILKVMCVFISGINQIYGSPLRRKRSSNLRIVIHCCGTHQYARNGCIANSQPKSRQSALPKNQISATQCQHGGLRLAWLRAIRFPALAAFAIFLRRFWLRALWK